MSVIINASTSSGLVQTADTSGTLELQSNGTTQLTVSSTGTYGQLKSGTAVSASSTSVDFTSIPSWVKRITVVMSGVSTSGTSQNLVQLGSGSVTNSGYLSYNSATPGGSSPATAITTTGFGVWNGNAAEIRYVVMTLVNISGNTWVSAHSGGSNNSTAYYTLAGGGNVTLSGTLDRIRITTVNGTDTFDAGSINILFEG